MQSQMYSQEQFCADDGYGSTAALPFKPRRMNGLGFSLSIFVPWGIFCANCAAMSFKSHYSQSQGSVWVALACLGVVAFWGYVAFSAVKARRDGRQNVEVNWFIFLFVVSLLAWIAGIAVGDHNFWANMQPYYEITNLNAYPSVDPSKANGQQMMDAGRIMFAQGTKVDVDLSTGFKNLDTYCVAPITIGNELLSSYDFWSVGLNCCSQGASDFHCGEFNNPHARGGLRLMDSGERAFYRLAVQQAEATHKIKAPHPIFLYWMQDPDAEIQSYFDNGLKNFLLGVMGYFACEVFVSLAAFIIFLRKRN